MCEDPKFIHLNTGQKVSVDALDPIADQPEQQGVPAADPVLPNEGLLLNTIDWGPIPTIGTLIDDGQPA